MKKYIIFFAIFLLGLTFASPIFAQETIRSFDVSIKINQDASISVSERIEYDFDGAQKHGIFRDIPIIYSDETRSFRLPISGISVTDQNGNALEFNVSDQNNDLRIKIGDPNKTVSGQKTYLIKHTVKGTINYFQDHDELYWNVTGDQWSAPIEKSSAKVELPQKIQSQQLQSACFVGELGSNEPCANIQTPSDSDGLNQEIIFQHNQTLVPGQGLTIVVGFPAGLVQKIEKEIISTETLDIFDGQNSEEPKVIGGPIFFAIPAAVLILMFFLWQRYGRDPKSKGVIIAQYGAPGSLTPAQVGTLIDERASNQDISAEIVNLAVKGHLKMTRLEATGGLLSNPDYELEKIKEADNLNGFQKSLMVGLFSKNTVKLTDLKERFYKDMEKIKQGVYASLIADGYFPKNPQKIRHKYIAAGIIAGPLALIGTWIASGILMIFNLELSFFIPLVVVMSGIIIAMFGAIMPSKTLKGVQAKEHIIGLKTYLTVAEKDRLKFHNAPAKNPKHFEALLPYAMALGVEREWGKQFEGIYNQPPEWYKDPTGRSFNSLLLIHGLSGFRQSANSALSSRPHSTSASRGHSGFGGGGHSGGGFGGGGGGSW